MRAAVALALAACLALGACNPGAPDVSARPVLPPVPADLEACIHREFPEIPERAFGRRDAVRIIGEAKLLDRAKTACGGRALSWMNEVVAAFGGSSS